MEQVKEIKKKALDIIELCASSTTAEDITDDQGWTKAHTAKTWMDIWEALNNVYPEKVGFIMHDHLKKGENPPHEGEWNLCNTSAFESLDRSKFDA